MTDLSRREFTKAAAIAGLGGLAAGPVAWARRLQGADDGLFDWRPVAGRSGALAGFNGGGNALLLVSGGQALLVDTKNSGLGPTLRREAEAAAGGSTLTTVVNTHHHGDHVGGNPSFTFDLEVIGHAQCAVRAEENAEQTLSGATRILDFISRAEEPPSQRVIDEVQAYVDGAGEIGAEAFAPTRRIEDDVTELTVGEIELTLHHPGNGHTDNDLFVHVPALNLIHTGDLVFHNLHCFIDVGAGATTRGWERSVQAMIDLCDADTIVVPGHGELTDVDGLRAQIEYFQQMREFVDEQRDEGSSKADIEAMTPDMFEGRGFERMGPANLGKMYDELEAEG